MEAKDKLPREMKRAERARARRTARSGARVMPQIMQLKVPRTDVGLALFARARPSFGRTNDFRCVAAANARCAQGNSLRRTRSGTDASPERIRMQMKMNDESDYDVRATQRADQRAISYLCAKVNA